MKRQQFGTPDGFTVLETLIAVVIGILLIATVLSFSTYQLAALQDQAKQIDLQTAARNVAVLFARDIDRAGEDPTCATSFEGIASATSSMIRVKADLNGNGAIDGGDEDLTYRYDFTGQTLLRVQGTSEQVLLAGVSLTGSAFRYFDGTGAELPATSALGPAGRNAVRRVRLELRISDRAATPNHRDLKASIETDISLRNRFFVSSTACS